MSAPAQPPGPGPDASAGEPRASTVLVGTVVALLAVVAVVAIVSGGGSEPAPSSVDAEERAIERAARGSAGAGPALGERTEVAERRADAGVRGGPEAGVAALACEGAPPPRAGTPSTAPPPSPYVPPPPGVRGPITLEQEYEATAFFLDMLVLRRDTVRRDLEEARRIGDGPRVRRLEPDEATLDEDIARMVTRSHELEARLRERAAEGAPAAEEPTLPEGL